MRVKQKDIDKWMADAPNEKFIENFNNEYIFIILMSSFIVGIYLLF